MQNLITKSLFGALAMVSLLTVGAQAQVSVATVPTSQLAEPYNVVPDPNDNLYISDSANNRIVEIDAATQAESTFSGVPSDPAGSNDGPPYAAHFNQPQGLLSVTWGGTNGLLVTDSGNHLIRFVNFSDGSVTTLAGQTNGGFAINAAGRNAMFRSPLGMDQDASGNVYIADFGNNTIRVMNINDPALGVTNLVIPNTTLYRPTAVAVGGSNQLWVADTGNQMIKLVSLTSPTAGTVISYLGANHMTGTADSAFGPNARFNLPSGLLFLNGVGLLISDTLNNTIRLATNNTIFGATNYSVITFAGTPGISGLVDGSASLAKFNSPYGMAIDLLNNGFLVADLKNNAVRRIQTAPPQPPVPAPQIGWVLFVKDAFGDFVTQLQIGSSFVFNNDETIAILGTLGTETHFTFGPTPSNPLIDTVPNPSASVGSSPPAYINGSHLAPTSIIAPQPDVTIKAIGFATGRQNSPIISSRFQFKVASPVIQGDNAAFFTVSDATDGALLWYSTDGSDPTNSAPSAGPIQSGTTLSLNASVTNITFKIRAFRNNYQNSDIITTVLSTNGFVPNQLSFGFSAGEASSDFVASPGQLFYAPVTLSLVSGTKMYSLQFNVTVTNAGPNPGPQILPGTFGFNSFLEKPDIRNPGLYIIIPPAMFGDHLMTNMVTITNVVGGVTNITTTNIVTAPIDPPPSFVSFSYNGQPGFISLEFTNNANNLLGVGWLERFGESFLYDTHVQDLIKYSQPHDTIFTEDGGRVVAGGYKFQMPCGAVPGQTYRIQIGRPSATSDGIGAPGSDVYIGLPVNGSLTNGPINSIKIVTAGQRKYIAGDCYPFRWFNAGDFGDTNLDNADVMQVFQTAVYNLNGPPDGSDFFDCMDSCGATYIDNNLGYLQMNNTLTGTALNPLFDGNDTTINQIAFGDGVLDVCDVYVTFRRSLDPSLVWFRRFWTNCARVAQIIGNPPPALAQANGGGSPQPLSLNTVAPSVNFASGDVLATAGQTLQVPITAKIFGSYPLRVMMLNLTVNPLDGSPALTSGVQFAPNSALGAPTITTSKGNGNYAATWLNSAISGLTSNATLGTLTIQIPSNAPSSAAYAIHFDHASASPNGLASFPKKTVTGLITLSDRSTSTYNDGIPDSWRLRYFGTVNNLLSQASADADGDGMNNLQEYIAGTDPTDPNSNLKASTDPAAAQSRQDCVIRWPSVAGKNYVIERSASLFGSGWMPVSTNAGTGTDMEYHDTTSGSVRFYRVRVAQ